MGNKITWTYEHEYADEQCGQVDKQENGDVHLSGSLAHIVCRGVEGDESRLLLHYDDGGGNGVAYNESLADDEYGKPQEGVSHAFALHAQCL